jgi:TPR repeat protein
MRSRGRVIQKAAVPTVPAYNGISHVLLQNQDQNLLQGLHPYQQPNNQQQSERQMHLQNQQLQPPPASANEQVSKGRADILAELEPAASSSSSSPTSASSYASSSSSSATLSSSVSGASKDSELTPPNVDSGYDELIAGRKRRAREQDSDKTGWDEIEAMEIALFGRVMRKKKPNSTTQHANTITYTEDDDNLVRDLFSNMWCSRDDAWTKLQRLAHSGRYLAKAAVAVCYGCPHIDVVKTDLTEARMYGEVCIEWLAEQSSKGLKSAQCFLGMFHENGIITHSDEKLAYELFRKSAEQGYSPAQYSLGVCYEIEQGIVGHQHEAIKWYRQAAEQGYIHAKVNIGTCYERGIGVAEDYQLAMKFYKEAADAFDLTALWSIGRLYERGYGVAADINTAKYWYSMAKNLGSMDAMVVRAQRLVRMDNYVDQQMGMDYYRDASKQKDVDAIRELGFIYRHGLSIWIEPQWLAARQCFITGAGLGDAASQNELGMIYLEGKGNMMPSQAIEYFRKAAARQFAPALCNLGFCYENGVGIDKDLHMAKWWYEQAADLGDPDGQAYLGRCFYKGVGVEIDVPKAMALLQKASACNHGPAKEWLSEVSQKHPDLFERTKKRPRSLTVQKP